MEEEERNRQKQLRKQEQEDKKNSNNKKKVIAIDNIEGPLKANSLETPKETTAKKIISLVEQEMNGGYILD